MLLRAVSALSFSQSWRRKARTSAGAKGELLLPKKKLWLARLASLCLVLSPRTRLLHHRLHAEKPQVPAEKPTPQQVHGERLREGLWLVGLFVLLVLFFQMPISSDRVELGGQFFFVCLRWRSRVWENSKVPHYAKRFHSTVDFQQLYIPSLSLKSQRN